MTRVVDGLVKRFGTVQALDGVSFGVEPGGICGFLGANVAGKTTTMRIVPGFLRPDAGTVTWRDREARLWPRRTWGYMPEERGLYLRMPVIDQLVFFGWDSDHRPARPVGGVVLTDLVVLIANQPAAVTTRGVNP